MNYRGYTLIELMLVVCLLMLLISIAVGSLSYDPRLIAHAELHKIYSVCSHLQMRARATNQVQSLVFDALNNAYSYNGVTELLPHQVVFGAVEGAKGPPSLPTHPITAFITSKNQCITFTPHGIIQPVTIYIKTSNNQWMYAITASVAQASFLRMYAYDHGVWKLLS